ncbi:alpha/beta hydrolase [Ktedonosporobacter rubrisoli]|uniref:Alpha/beta hydrolase n=1 Tax=Ktedonosporobacter rubrisoli TaxID=2509675 RepID=A0A4P6K0I7_KTERU|nr:alpha/beta hydrolase [Ktedonosporobacter rubrisoli]QBD81140.1 alpha/beta hydrolase [Ktedonosporobacter rubrisoli]
MSSKHTQRSKVSNGDVKLAVSLTGKGQQLIFFNGLGATQAIWKSVIRHLTGQYQVVTFDFRGHGKATGAKDYSFDSFLTDAEAVLAAWGKDKPLLVAWSMGADLAIRYAAAHPGSVGGILIIDGALPAQLIDDPEEVKRLLHNPWMRLGFFALGLIGMGYQLSPDEQLTLNMQLDASRKLILQVYEKLDCPVELILASKTAGEKGAYASRINMLWLAAAERLASTYPALPIHWLESIHQLPLKKPVELARAIDDFSRRVKREG